MRSLNVCWKLIEELFFHVSQSLQGVQEAIQFPKSLSKVRPFPFKKAVLVKFLLRLIVEFGKAVVKIIVAAVVVRRKSYFVWPKRGCRWFFNLKYRLVSVLRSMFCYIRRGGRRHNWMDVFRLWILIDTQFQTDSLLISYN